MRKKKEKKSITERLQNDDCKVILVAEKYNTDQFR